MIQFYITKLHGLRTLLLHFCRIRILYIQYKYKHTYVHMHVINRVQTKMYE